MRGFIKITVLLISFLTVIVLLVYAANEVFVENSHNTTTILEDHGYSLGGDAYFTPGNITIKFKQTVLGVDIRNANLTLDVYISDSCGQPNPKSNYTIYGFDNSSWVEIGSHISGTDPTANNSDKLYFLQNLTNIDKYADLVFNVTSWVQNRSTEGIENISFKIAEVSTAASACPSYHSRHTSRTQAWPKLQFDFSDTINPTFSGLSNNASSAVEGDVIKWNVLLSDNQLEKYMFAHNQTGTLTNGTPTDGWEVIQNFTGFEADADGWVDTGPYTERSTSVGSKKTDSDTNGGSYAFNLDYTGYTYKNFSFVGYNVLNITFWHRGSGVDDSECFRLYIEGEEVGEWGTTGTCDTDTVSNSAWVQASVVLNAYDYHDDNIEVRFAADYDSSSDHIYIDGIKITGERHQSASIDETLTITASKGSNICGQFWFNDTWGNENQTGLSCFTTVNDVPTTPTVTSPTDETYYQDLSFINYTSLDSDSGDTLTYKIYINGTLNISTTTNVTDWNASDGYYNLTVSATDGTASSANSTSIQFYMDSTVPTISWEDPTPADASRSILNVNTINISYSDVNFETCILEFDGTNETFQNSNSVNYWEPKSTFDGNNYTINAYCNDSAGNWNNAGERWYYENQEPDEPTMIKPTNNNAYASLSEINYSCVDDDDDSTSLDVYIGDVLNMSRIGNTSTWNISGGQYSFKASCWDGYESSTWNTSFTFYIDEWPPWFEKNNTNNSNPQAGETINVNITINYTTAGDPTQLGNTAVDWYVFAHNETGTMTNQTFVNINGWGAVYSWNITLSNMERDDVLGWQVWANDSVGNSNASQIYTITIANSLPTTPTIHYPSDDSYYTDIPYINFSSTDNDPSDTLTYKIYINGTLNISTTTNVTDWNASDGYYELNVSVTDSVDSSANTTIQFTLDTIIPTVNWESPTPADSARTTGNSHTFNISFSDVNPDNCIFEWNGTNETWTSSDSTNYWETKATNDGGTYTIVGYCNDSAGNWNNTLQRSFTENTAPTTPSIIYPTDETWYSDIPYINFSSTDAEGDTLTYKLYINNSLNISTTTNVTDWNASDGYYNLTISVTDSYESSANATAVQFHLDATPPTSSYESPTPADSSRTIANSITINISYADANFDTCILDWNGTNETFTSSNSTNFWETKATTDGQIYTFQTHCNDSAGNWNNTAERTFTENNEPSVASATINNSEPSDLEDLSCLNGSVTDTEGDTVTLTYDWLKDEVSQGINSFNLSYSHTTGGEIWKCKITPNDGYEDGAIKTSSSVSIATTYVAPSINWTNATTNNIASDANNPTNNGSTINLSVYFYDKNSDEAWSAYFCKTDAATSSGCTGNSWCNSSINATTYPEVACILNTSGYSNGVFNYYVFVVDNQSLISSSSYNTFEVNYYPTTPTIVEPTGYVTTSYTLVNFTSTDADSDTINYSIYNSTDDSTWSLLNENSSVYNWTNLADGTYYLKASSEDEHGYSNYENSSSYSFVIDATDPLLISLSVASTSIYTTGSATFYANISDATSGIAASACEFTVRKSDFNSGNKFNITSGTKNGDLLSVSQTVTTYGVGTLEWQEAHCQDIAGNIVRNQTVDINITITTEPDPVNTGGGGLKDEEIVQAVTQAVTNATICGNGVCQEGENPLTCGVDCPFNADELFCPLVGDQECPAWVFNFLIYLVVGVPIYITYKKQTKGRKKKGSIKKSLRRLWK